MKEIIEVPRGDKTPSKVVVGDVITSLRSYLPEKKVIIITDSNVHQNFRDLIDPHEYIVIGTGEQHKTMQTLEEVYRRLIAAGADRGSFILGFGGGIVTDVAGFAASTFMRGINFGFVATTLLAQVDASIGGKNGVNVDGFKNMAGVFNQPDFVLCDTSTLATLPDNEFRGGLAEVIKAGVIADPALFAMLEGSSFEDLRSDNALLGRVITAAIRVKAAIVEADEHEAGVRKLLNLGHTFAHAIEKCSRSYTHGEAVAVGLCMASDVAVRLGLMPACKRTRIKALVEHYGLPLSTSVDPAQLIKAAASDKKRSGNSLDLILPMGLGHCEIHNVALNELYGYF